MNNPLRAYRIATIVLAIALLVVGTYAVTQKQRSVGVASAPTIEQVVQAKTASLPADQKFSLLGYDESMIVYLQMDKANSPGPCANMWLAEDVPPTQEKFAIDVRNIGAGLQPYHISNAKHAEQETLARACEAEFWGE